MDSRRPAYHRRKQHKGKSLHVAARLGNAALVERLLARRSASVDVRATGSRYTALHVAALRGHVNVVEVLLRRGARVDAHSASGDTPLHCALRKRFAPLARLLLANGADPNHPAADRRLPLFAALEDRDQELVRLLMLYGARADVVNAQGESPLHVAIRAFDDEENRRYNISVWLLSRRVPIDRRDFSGSTALHRALELRAKEQLVLLLIARGADVHLRDHAGRSPLRMLAVGNGFPELARRLREPDAERPSAAEIATALRKAVAYHDDDMVRTLLRNGADGTDGFVVNLAARIGTVYALKLLVSRGADVNAGAGADLRSRRGSLLASAVNFERFDAVEYLLENGADVNQEIDGVLPLTASVSGLIAPDCKSASFLLLKHIALRVSLGLYVSEQNMDFIRNHVVASNEYEICCREIEMIKVTKICEDHSVTYLDLLTKRDHGLMRCLRNEMIRDAVSSGHYKTKFPAYADQLERICRRGSQRLWMIDAFQQTLHDFFASAVMLPYNVTRRITEYLYDDDLEALF